MKPEHRKKVATVKHIGRERYERESVEMPETC
jgi:hypothetical protein